MNNEHTLNYRCMLCFGFGSFLCCLENKSESKTRAKKNAKKGVKRIMLEYKTRIQNNGFLLVTLIRCYGCDNKNSDICSVLDFSFNFRQDSTSASET